MAIALGFKKAAEETSLSVRTLQYAADRGELETVRVGRRRLILVRSLEKFLMRGKSRTNDNQITN